MFPGKLASMGCFCCSRCSFVSVFLGQADLNHVPAIFHDYRIIAIINFGSGTRNPSWFSGQWPFWKSFFMLKSDVVKSYIMNDAGNMMNWAVFLIEMFKIDFWDWPTSRAIKILLLEEIPNNHLGCIKPCKYWDTLPTSTGERQISEPSLVSRNPTAQITQKQIQLIRNGCWRVKRQAKSPDSFPNAVVS